MAPENVRRSRPTRSSTSTSTCSKDEYKPELDKIADVMIADTSTQFLVWGLTDTVGTAEYNQELSERRAEAVAAYLESKGVSRDRMTIKGFGMTKLRSRPRPNARSRRTAASRSVAAKRRLERLVKRGRGLRAAPFLVCAQRRPRSGNARLAHHEASATASTGRAKRSSVRCKAPPIRRCAISAGQSGRGSSISQTSVRL